MTMTQMTRDTLKDKIIEIIIKMCGYEDTFFSVHPDDGEYMLMNTVIPDPLDFYEVLSEIEHVCKILVNDELLFKQDTTFKDFIDIFYNELERERRGY